ncbi:MAG TPA: Holliday junction resolvase RuvX [Ilumatobacteraceae bacterium]|nr:Holliday junction resolvase RuvX [Ilumatobacteraceae bacterium]
MSRVLGLDLGSKRIGVAVSDPTRTIATALTVIQRSGSRQRDHQRIAELVAEEEATAVIVGLPTNMSGSYGPAARAALSEIEALASVIDVPVTTIDERRTTVTADQAMIEGGLNGKQRRKVVDRVAAAILLQSWLNREHGR